MKTKNVTVAPAKRGLGTNADSLISLEVSIDDGESKYFIGTSAKAF
jgi:hypothetical protein